MNELPLRCLFKKLDGETKGPNLHNGPIGKKLLNVTDLPIVNFNTISFDEDFMHCLNSLTDISSDQKYLRDALIAVSSGIVPPSFDKRSPGMLGYARWLTTANRIIRYYMSVIDPSETLIRLMKYIINVYSRMWFEIRYKPSIKNAAKHVFNMIKYLNSLTDRILSDIVEPVIQRNGYMIHSESILLAMLCDDETREEAITKIIEARQINGDNKKRKFLIPKINFQADAYFSLIDWSDLHEPSLTMEMAIEELQTVNSDDFLDYPCHSQAVERIIRIVSQTSKMLADPSQRDSRIYTTIIQRKKMPVFNHKSQFVID